MLVALVVAGLAVLVLAGLLVRKELQLEAVLQGVAEERAALQVAFERERGILLNRIQAPETGIAQSLDLDDAGPQGVPFDNDRAFFEAQGRTS